MALKQLNYWGYSKLDKFVSRFFKKNDLKRNNFIFKLPKSKFWYSRQYEYAWAAQFANWADIVLDAACGIIHPLKFYLSDICKEVFACDFNDKITSINDMLKEIKNAFGEESLKNIPKNYKTINYCKASLTSLPYKNKQFDKIFCISVLEHLNNVIFVKYPFILKFLNFLFYRDNIYLALKEFKRILKDDGLIILTFDYPDINIKYLYKILSEIELEFASKIILEIPENAIYSEDLKIYCFRAVLRKTKIKQFD